MTGQPPFLSGPGPYSIHLSPPDAGPAEEEAVVRALRSGWLASMGPELELFEQEVAAAAGRRGAVAVASGTAALHLALLCAGVTSGDVVICPTLTFVATANAITYTGATPHFVDCDETGNLDPVLLRAALQECAAAGVRVSAVVVVDMLGKVADYTAICTIADEYGIPVISDSAEALGASRAGAPAGSFGLCATFSFNGNKIVTSAGGGALVSDDPTLLSRVKYLAAQARQPADYYEHAEVGYNYRLSNLLAAVGRAQLARLPEFLASRRRTRSRYRELCGRLTGVEIFGGDDDGDNCWLTGLVIEEDLAGCTAQLLGQYLKLEGIETRPMWKPMHLQPMFADERHYPRTLNGTAEYFFAHGLLMPSGSGLTELQRQFVIERTCFWAGQPELGRPATAPLEASTAIEK